MAATLNQQPYPVGYITAYIMGLLPHMVVCLLSTHFKRTSNLYSQPGSTRLPGGSFSRVQSMSACYGSIVAWLRHCLHTCASAGPAGGWSPSVFQGLVLSGTSWERNPRVLREPVNSILGVVLLRTGGDSASQSLGMTPSVKQHTHPLLWGLQALRPLMAPPLPGGRRAGMGSLEGPA